MFTIVIPSWNNLRYLKLTIGSIRRYSAWPHQIVVHVNEGADGTMAWLDGQDIEATHSAGNHGVCMATNLAAAQARHDYIVYMNDDMVCCPGWDTALMRRIAAMRTDLFMLSGTMIEPSNTKNRCNVVADFGRDIDTFREDDLMGAAPTLVRGDWLGATWPPTLIPRDWWRRLGGFSSELSPGFSSDNDLSMKMWHAGCRIFLGVGDSLVYHFARKTTGRVIANDGRRQFLDKWRITQRTFDRRFLRRGEPVTGSWALDTPAEDIALRLARFRGHLRRCLG